MNNNIFQLGAIALPVHENHSLTLSISSIFQQIWRNCLPGLVWQSRGLPKLITEYSVMATEAKELVIETKETQLEEVDAPKGKAKFKDCMLELTLPKKSAKHHNLKIE